MPPKNTSRGKKPVPPPVDCDFDNTCFVSRKSQDYFEAKKNNGDTVEKGFDLQDCNLDAIVKHYKLKKLLAKPTRTGSKLLVREFFANFHSAPEATNVWVRGYNIDVSYDAINNFYGTECVPISECTYWRFRSEMKQGLADSLAKFSEEFGIDIDTDNIRGGYIFHVSELSLELWALYQFICERILPTSHYQDVHWVRAPLLYAMIRRMPVNFGSIIKHEIGDRAKNLENKNFVFPILITTLAEKACVPMARFTKNLSAGKTITKASMESGSSRIAGHDQVQHDEDDEPDMTPREHNYYLSGQIHGLEEKLKEIQEQHFLDNYHLMCREDRRDERIEKLENEMHDEFQENRYFRQRMFGQFFPGEPYPPPYYPPPYAPPQEPATMEWDGPSWDDQSGEQGHQNRATGSGTVGAWGSIFPPPQ